MDITIRIADPQDCRKLLAIYRPYVEHTAITFEYEVPTETEFAGRIAHTLKRYPYLVAQQGDQILGYAYAGPFQERAAYEWAVETSIYVCMDYRQCGIGRKLYENLEQILCRQGIRNVNACIAYTQKEDAHLTNDSVHFHERLGYRMVGTFHQCGYKFDRWYDMVWMEKMIGTHSANPSQVRLFSELRHSDTFSCFG